MNNAAMNFHIQVSICVNIYFHFLLDSYLGLALLGHVVTLF